jgi:hypothetical protein
VKLGVSESAGCECERTAGQERRPDGVHGREEVHRARAHGLMALETKKEKKAKDSVRLRVIIHTSIQTEPTNAGCRTLFLKEHSNQSILEHMNHLMDQ